MNPILVLADALQKSECERGHFIKENLAILEKAELMELLINVLNVGNQYAASCDEALWLQVVTRCDVHPDRLDYNHPAFSGALKGLIIAGKASKKDQLCKSCAYREGTLANHSLSTQDDLAFAIADEAIFYCHENIVDGQKLDMGKVRPCRGWAQHIKNRGAA